MSGFDNEVVVSVGDRLEPSSSQAIQLMQKEPTDVARINYTGDPEGVVSANPASLCHDPVSGEVRVKTQGTDSTGWSILEPTADTVGALAYFSTANGDAYLGDKWLKCDGRIVDQADYPLLFERIGYINGPFTNFLTTTTYTSSVIAAMIFDGTRFVASGSGGNVGTSTNGQNWTLTTQPTTNSIQNLIYAGGVYYMPVGPQVATTTNLNAYGSSQSGNANSNQLVYSGTLFLTTHTTRYTATSNDAITWNTRTPQGNSLAYGNSALVASSTLNTVFTATDPTLHWRVVAANIQPTVNLSDVVFINNLFVATSASSSTIGTSTDGYTWTSRSTGTTTAWNTAAFGAGVYVLAGATGGTFRATTDFVTYTGSTTGSGIAISNLAYGASKFVSVQNTAIFTSTDGYTSWSNSGTLTSAGSPPTLKFLNGIFIAGSAGGLLSTSTDGITWSQSSPYGVLVMQDVIFANSLYVACFSNGSVASSTYAVTWTSQTTLTTSSLGGIAWDGSRYYVTADTLVQTSTDLITWTRVSNLPNSTELLNVLEYGNSLFLIGTSLGNILSSTDAVTWSSHATLTNLSLTALFAGDGIYLAARNNALYRSTNLTTFTAMTTNATATQSINVIEKVNDLYIAGGNQGYIRTSTDGITWDQVSTTITNQSMQAAAASTSTIVFGGSSGFVGFSLDTYPYDENTEFQLPTDAGANITVEYPSNFRRALYVRAA